MRIIILLALVILSGMQRRLEAQSPTSFWSEDSIVSSKLGATRYLRISLPDEYGRHRGATDRYPVVIVAGAEDNAAFAALIANLRVLSGRLGNAVPPSIVVGLLPGPGPSEGYPPGSAALILREQRTRADTVADFVALELLSWVRERYRTLPYTVIAGHSAPGRFAIYTFARYPETFQAAIAVSPAYWSISGVANDSALSATDATRIAQDGRRRKLFVSIGSYDPVPIREGVRQFNEQLVRQQMPRSEFEYRRFPQDNHQTIRVQGFIDGLRWVFAPVSLSENEVYAGMAPFGNIDASLVLRRYQTIKERYAQGASELGLPGELPEKFLSSMAGLFTTNRRPGLLEVGRRMCEDYLRWHKSPWAHVCLGDVLLSSGDSLGARRQYETALELARSTGMNAVLRVLERRVTDIDPVRPPR